MKTPRMSSSRGQDVARSAALAASAQLSTDLGEGVGAHPVPNCNGVALEQTSSDAALRELFESGAINGSENAAAIEAAQKGFMIMAYRQ
ncbi:hypothetical protein THAOC_14345 [Thalassiosira oceanica]|uniref:Uncharacterized protein n=1 Tax=Thalassiosira oceanica TaxID=159749 RepID=K0SV07_THAOC|nr:hypothetical protein THAOC_14345 [Thalassiosira oceanica]|eukprot:EJK64871.1 hypothetical protein THAOC_14345 [Thalassiosira oceanica]